MWIIKHYYQRKAWPSIFRPRPPTRIRLLCDETEIFSSVACRPHVSGENVHQKPLFSKTLSRVEIFENAGFSTTCRRTKTEVFQYDDVIHHNTTSITHALWGLPWYFHRVSVLLVDGPKRFQYATCGREFFRTRRKKLFVFKNIRLRVDGSLASAWEITCLSVGVTLKIC